MNEASEQMNSEALFLFCIAVREPLIVIVMNIMSLTVLATATSRSLYNDSVSVSISVKLHSTVGVLYRWYRTLKVWDSRSFLSGKVSKICLRPQRNL